MSKIPTNLSVCEKEGSSVSTAAAFKVVLNISYHGWECKWNEDIPLKSDR